MNNRLLDSQTPRIDPPSQEVIEKFRRTSKKDRRAFYKSDYYKQKVAPTLRRRKAQKRELRRQWWRSNCLSVLSLVIALASLVVSIIAILQ